SEDYEPRNRPCRNVVDNSWYFLLRCAQHSLVLALDTQGFSCLRVREHDVDAPNRTPDAARNTHLLVRVETKLHRHSHNGIDQFITIANGKSLSWHGLSSLSAPVRKDRSASGVSGIAWALPIHLKFLSAITSFAGVRSPVQLIRRGALT